MKLSELIKSLQKTLEEEGDIRCLTMDNYYGYFEIDDDYHIGKIDDKVNDKNYSEEELKQNFVIF